MITSFTKIWKGYIVPSILGLLELSSERKSQNSKTTLGLLPVISTNQKNNLNFNNKSYLLIIALFCSQFAFSKGFSPAEKNFGNTSSCTGFKTYTQGGWGADARGNNPGAYRDANFAAAFPSGLTIGCSNGNKMILTTSAAVNDFLPSGSTASVLPAGTLTNPGSSYSNVLAGQLVAATLNVGFDAYDANFSSNSINTGNLYITSGTFKGFTVNQLIAAANDVIGGCSTAYTVTDLNVALTSFNENYDNGTTDNGFTTCTSPCNLSVNGTKTDITCNNANNGAINITPSGANGTVTYLWNDGSTDEDRSDLAAGDYSVTATDEAGCTATSNTFSIVNPDPVNVSGTTIDVTVVNASTGSIDITVSGGTPPYTYLWNDGSTDEDRTNLAAGDYSVIVSDKNNCNASESFTIKQPNCDLSVSGSKTDITCNNSNNGSISIEVSGANGGVTYLWNDGSTDENRSDLAAGDYSVTATDEAGCTATSNTFSIVNPDPVNVSGTTIDVTVVNASTGSIDITVSGGTPPYTYLWNDGSTDEDRTNLAAGDYSVIVSDKNNCNASESFTIKQPTCNLSLTYTEKRASCWDSNNGAIDLTVTGANGTVSYLWNDGVTTEDRSNLYAGYYTVNVTDEAGCNSSLTIHVHHPSKLTASYVSTPCSTNPCNGTATVSAKGGTKPYKYTWNDGYVGASRTGLCPGAYSVTVTDKNKCTFILKVFIKRGASAAVTSSQTMNSSSFTASVSPNPVQNIAIVNWYSVNSGNYLLKLVDITGKVLLQQKGIENAGMNNIKLDLQSFGAGTYFVNISLNEKESYNLKLIKE